MALPSYTQQNVSLAKKTTLEVGGPAAELAMPVTEAETVDTYRALDADGVAVLTLGGGSNMLISDGGWDGTVVQSNNFAMSVTSDGDDRLVEVAAGIEWDELVAFCVDENFAGLECLSGIPGRVGAAPIQNIGAYGQEVAEVVEAVRCLDRGSGEVVDLPASECGFGYRSSKFKDEWRQSHVILSLTLRLRAGGDATVRYPELRSRLGMADGLEPPPLGSVRDIVLRIRRRKSMVSDPTDPNRRSAGSFFTNPIVADDVLEKVKAAATGIEAELPMWPTDAGGTKLSAAWLIERTGFERGFTFGKVGLSSNHCLALINRGGARAESLVALASLIRRQVRTSFGVTLHPEPAFVGFDQTADELLG
jgi:UDP-N-acetylmuramate dehydrogenase